MFLTFLQRLTMIEDTESRLTAKRGNTRTALIMKLESRWKESHKAFTSSAFKTLENQKLCKKSQFFQVFRLEFMIKLEFFMRSVCRI